MVQLGKTDFVLYGCNIMTRMTAHQQPQLTCWGFITRTRGKRYSALAQ